ncbi:MAG: peroxiredoxin family protein [Hyphomicrobiaceae bacterium]
MSEQNTLAMAPELSVEQWFNTESDLTLEKLRGRPVLIHAFQMLCPGCVAHAIPQTQKVQALFGETDLQVIGLHTVFEHHAAMTPVALKAFIHEYRLTFPIGVDTAPSTGDIPATMAAYAMRGTPTTILIDRDGNVAANLFGQIEDLALGAMIQSLTGA